MIRPFRIVCTCLVASVMLGHGLVLYSSNEVPDDAFISLRYARNLADGEGLRFNPGGERVEGFSSPLHVLGMAAAIGLGAGPLPVSQLSSLLGAVFVASLVAWWTQRRFGHLWGLVAGLSVALNPSLAMWSRGGLETTLFTALIVATLVAAAERRWWAVGTLAGLLAVTRPEGPLYGLALVVFVLVFRRRELATYRGPALLALGTWLTWFLFRIFYFGDTLPNTYYAKMDGIRAVQARRGLVYAGEFLERSEIMVPLVVIGSALLVLAVLRARGHGGGDPQAAWTVLAGSMVVTALAFVLLAGGDHMTHARFLVPSIPLVMVLAVWSATQLASAVPAGRWRAVASGALALVLLSQPIRIVSHDLRHPRHPLDRPLQLVEPFSNRHIPMMFKLGSKLRDLLPPDTVIAVVPAGALPYASGFTTIDMLGLNDREIARLRVPDMGAGRMGHEKGNGAIVLARRPDVILLRNLVNPVPGEPAGPDRGLEYRPNREIWASPGFHADYEAFVVEVEPGMSYTLHRRRTPTSE